MYPPHIEARVNRKGCMSKKTMKDYQSSFSLDGHTKQNILHVLLSPATSRSKIQDPRSHGSSKGQEQEPCASLAFCSIGDQENSRENAKNVRS